MELKEFTGGKLVQAVNAQVIKPRDANMMLC